jgi:hypothetical protein
MFWIILGVALWIMLAFWPAMIAKRKGYSFWLFFAISVIVSWLLALVLILILEDKNKTAADRADDRAAEAALDAEEAKTRK